VGILERMILSVLRINTGEYKSDFLYIKIRRLSSSMLFNVG
jgi:hypothetical protein